MPKNLRLVLQDIEDCEDETQLPAVAAAAIAGVAAAHNRSGDITWADLFKAIESRLDEGDLEEFKAQYEEWIS